jgi:hypothetical protein
MAAVALVVISFAWVNHALGPRHNIQRKRWRIHRAGSAGLLQNILDPSLALWTHGDLSGARLGASQTERCSLRIMREGCESDVGGRMSASERIAGGHGDTTLAWQCSLWRRDEGTEGSRGD